MRMVRETVERVFYEEHGRLMAALIRLFGDFDLAEDVLQEAFAVALHRWSDDRMPDNPAAWIMTAARRKAIDRLRRDRLRGVKYAALHVPVATGFEDEVLNSTADPWADDLLRLMFTCCHPALSRDAQVALTLRTLGGLTTSEIARAFLLPEPTIAQRLVRAKRKIREARIPFRSPAPEQFSERLASVLTVIYLIFNEGYAASSGEQPVRHDLCAEALRFGRDLAALMPEEAEVLGLLALMLLHHSRREARLSSTGELVPLEEQNRTQWNRQEIAEALGLVERTLHMRRLGPYQIQAMIGALHVQPATADQTDWPQIAALYGLLCVFNPSPVVELNRAVAVAMAYGPEHGLRLIDDRAVVGALSQYRWLYSTRAALLQRAGRTQEAASDYLRAFQLTVNQAERRFLLRRLAELGAAPPLS